MSKERLPKISSADALGKMNQATGVEHKKLYEFSIQDIYQAVSNVADAEKSASPFAEALYQVDSIASQTRQAVERRLGSVSEEINSLRESLNEEQQKEFDMLLKAHERSRRGLLAASIRHKVFQRTEFSVEDNTLTIITPPEDKPQLKYLSGMRVGERAQASLKLQGKEVRDPFAQFLELLPFDGSIFAAPAPVRAAPVIEEKAPEVIEEKQSAQEQPSLFAGFESLPWDAGIFRLPNIRVAAVAEEISQLVAVTEAAVIPPGFVEAIGKSTPEKDLFESFLALPTDAALFKTPVVSR